MPPKRRTSIHPNTMARIRVAVFTRDAFQCRACGWAPSVVPPNYDGRYTIAEHRPGDRYRLLELDHVVPYSAGGLFVETNLQTLCNRCNASKGAKV